MQPLTGTFGFLGYGNMGTAIVSGLLRREMLQYEQLMVCDVAPGRMDEAKRCGLLCAMSVRELVMFSDTLILAIKPQQLDAALAAREDATRPDARVISIMAGVSIATLAAYFGDRARILRVMPNTPALVGEGAAALAHNDHCSDEDVAATRAVFEAVGVVEVVEERHMDAVTALSGSGPAYYFYLTECLIEAAVAEGLPVETARRLAGHTMSGASRLLVSTGATPDVLREQVTSKGGTTFAALETLRARDFSGVVGAAYAAAAERSRELGRQQ